MKTFEYILMKQICWAKTSGLNLIGSKGDKGRQAYTPSLELNLFEPLMEINRSTLIAGDGGELVSRDNSPCKMQAVHSSSALGLNVFQYWQRRNLLNTIASACGFNIQVSDNGGKLSFEKKFPISSKFKYAPNIDIVIESSSGITYAIESKFSEAYSSRGHSGIKEKYLELTDVWSDIPAIHELAKSISPNDHAFQFLHSAQLIKHILGLKNHCGREGFYLLYLWYDVPGEDGSKHRSEIETFKEITTKDSIQFSAMSYQELLLVLSSQVCADHSKYINYICSRYL